MKIAIICSNLFNIDKKSKKGTDIFNHILINNLDEHKSKDCDITVFASGASTLPLEIKSVDFLPSSADPKIIKNCKHVMFELALISKAFSMQDEFDVYHVNIGDGDLVMPFAAFTNKPILITLHNIIDEDFTRKYFSIFKNRKNVFFISASNYQKKILPDLNYAETIYHGIDTEQFVFDSHGGTDIMWAGRLIPGKGPDLVIKLAEELRIGTKLFGIVKDGYEDWFEHNIDDKIREMKDGSNISIRLNYERARLIEHFQSSKLFLMPTLLEEAFGFVYAESMSCGTPVVTFARGSAPEIIKDGETGFLVNPSDADVRGDWIIKKTGFAGLCEAVEKMYSLTPDEYMAMRKACRQRAVDNFSAEKMAKNYMAIYKKIICL